MNKIDKFDNMPNKESMRGSHHEEGWDMKMYDQGMRNYKIVSRYIDKCLRKSIGKNFDKVKKHIYEKMCYHNISKNDKNIIETNINWYIGEDDSKYTLDGQNRIQLNKVYLEKLRYWKEQRDKSKCTIIDTSKDITYRLREDITDSEIEKMKSMLILNGSYNKEFFNHISNGGIISSSIYNEFISNIKYDDVIKGRWGYDYIYDTKKFVESCFSIYSDNVVYIFDEKSSEYIRYKKECSDRKRKENRERKKEREEYNESLLFRLENNKKCREEEKNNIDRDRLGFDDESFKGEPYHGQKRKKKKQ